MGATRVGLGGRSGWSALVAGLSVLGALEAVVPDPERHRPRRPPRGGRALNRRLRRERTACRAPGARASWNDSPVIM